MHFTATELLVMQHWLFIWKEISSSLCLFTEVQLKYMLPPPPQVSYTQTCLEAQQQRSWTCPSSLMMRRSMFGLLSSGTSTWGRRRRTGSGELAKLKKHDTFHCFLAHLSGITADRKTPLWCWQLWWFGFLGGFLHRSVWRHFYQTEFFGCKTKSVEPDRCFVDLEFIV